MIGNLMPHAQKTPQSSVAHVIHGGEHVKVHGLMEKLALQIMMAEMKAHGESKLMLSVSIGIVMMTGDPTIMMTGITGMTMNGTKKNGTNMKTEP